MVLLGKIFWNIASKLSYGSQTNVNKIESRFKTSTFENPGVYSLEKQSKCDYHYTKPVNHEVKEQKRKRQLTT